MKKINNTTSRFANTFHSAYNLALMDFCLRTIGDNEFFYDVEFLQNNRGLFYGFFLNSQVEAELTSFITKRVAFWYGVSFEEMESTVKDYIENHYFGGLSYIDALWATFNELWR